MESKVRHNCIGFFTMVVSFARSTFSLDEDTASFALEATIQGLSNDLRFSIIRDLVFSFTVSCEDVGVTLLEYDCMHVFSSNVASTCGVLEVQTGEENLKIGRDSDSE